MKTNLIIIVFFSSCSLLNFSNNSTNNKASLTYKKKYILTDKSGEFLVLRESGFSKKNYFTKYRVFSTDGEKEKILEQSVVISTPGKIKKLSILRPKIYQYQVWFDKKKYMAEGKLNAKNRSITVDLKSPEAQWNNIKEYKFPKGNGVFCFFSQLLECAHMTGFLRKAQEKGAGEMSFQILIEGFPYFQEQYLNVGSELFSRASLKYDGKNKEGNIRFSLKFGNTTVFYFINDSYQLIKMFWPSQGFSMIPKES